MVLDFIVFRIYKKHVSGEDFFLRAFVKIKQLVCHFANFLQKYIFLTNRRIFSTNVLLAFLYRQSSLEKENFNLMKL